MGLEEKTILKHEDFFARSVNIGITSDAIVDKINAFDWLDLTEAKTEIEYSKVLLSIFERFNFKYPKKYDSIVKNSFGRFRLELPRSNLFQKIENRYTAQCI